MIPQDVIPAVQQIKYPIKKAHYVGTSVVLTIDPSHVKRLNIDELTFLIQKPVENGIVLEMHKIDTLNKKGEEALESVAESGANATSRISSTFQGRIQERKMTTIGSSSHSSIEVV